MQKKEQILRTTQYFIPTEARFNLRNPKSDKPTSVYMVIRLNNKQVKIPTKMKCFPSQWDKKKYCAMVSVALNDLDNRNNLLLNAKIVEMKTNYSKLFLYLCAHVDEISNPQSAINSIFGMARKPKKQQPLSAILLTALNNKNMAESSYKMFYGALMDFVKYLGEDNKTMTLDDVDVDVVRGYVDYMFSVKSKHKWSEELVSMENNTARNKLQTIATIFGYAEYEGNAFKKVRGEVKGFAAEDNQVALNDDEINIMRSIELNDKLSQVRDVFLFQLSIAQRWSDVEALLGKEVKVVNNTLVIIQKKTKTRVNVPIDDMAKEILEKYDYVLPKVRYRKAEDSIKVIGKLCGFDTLIQVRELRANEWYEFSVPKYKMLGTHTTRRSGITNLLKDGIDGEVVRKVSGHKSTESFARYNRMSSDDAAQLILSRKASKSSQVDNVPQTSIEPVKTQITDIQKALSIYKVDPMLYINVEDKVMLLKLLETYEDSLLMSIKSNDIKSQMEKLRRLPCAERAVAISALHSQEIEKNKKFDELVALGVDGKKAKEIIYGK